MTATTATNLQMALAACYLMGLGALLAFLREDLGLSLTVTGALGTVSAGAGILGSLIAPRLALRWGRSASIGIAVVGLSVGLLVIGLAPAAVPAAVGIVLATGCGFVYVITVSAFLLDHHAPHGPAALTTANAWAALGGTVMPLLLGIAAGTVLGWRAGVIAVVAALAAVEVLRRRGAGDYGHPRTPTGSGRQRPALPPRLWWAMLALVCTSAAEFTVVFWGAEFLRERTDASLAVAAIGIGAVNAGILLGRLVVARLASHVAVDGVLAAGLLLVLLAFSLLWSTRSVVAGIAACGVIGVGLAANWPLGCARCVSIGGGHTDRVLGRAFLANSAAAAVAPIGLALLAEQLGLHASFLIVAVLCLASLAVLAAFPAPRAAPVEVVIVPN